MWTKLQAYHDQHFDECVIALQEKYYRSKLSADESIAISISSDEFYASYTCICVRGKTNFISSTELTPYRVCLLLRLMYYSMITCMHCLIYFNKLHLQR